MHLRSVVISRRFVREVLPQAAGHAVNNGVRGISHLSARGASADAGNPCSRSSRQKRTKTWVSSQAAVSPPTQGSYFLAEPGWRGGGGSWGRLVYHFGDQSVLPRVYENIL